MKEKNSTRPEAYPKPTTTDNQLQNQPEYIDQQPNTFEEDVSNLPADKQREQSNERSSRAEDI